MTYTPTTDAEARDLLIGSPCKGDDVVVVKGRKVPIGTRGVLRWEGHGNYGPRVGIAVPGEPKLAYTAASNVEVVWPGLDPGQSPEEGWLALWHRNLRDRRLPERGHRVRALQGGDIVGGEVIWVSPDGTRLGFKESPGADPFWRDADKCSRVLRDGSLVPYILRVSAKTHEDPKGMVSYAVDPRKVEVYPAPFSAIRRLDLYAPNRVARAFDARGDFLMEIPERSLQQFDWISTTG